MEFSERAIILRIGKFKEADLWLKLLTPERGLISAFAFGGSRSVKRFAGCLDLFNQNLFKFKSGRQGAFLHLAEAVLLKAPQHLRTDLSRLGQAANCSRFVEAFGAAPGSSVTFELFEALLDLLEDGEAPKSPNPMTSLFFRSRLIFSEGYALDLEHCSACGLPLRAFEEAALAPSASFLLCPDCLERLGADAHPLESGGSYCRLHRESLDALAYVFQYPVNEWPGISLSPGGARECARALDMFVRQHTGLVWDNGRFVRH